MKPIGSLYLVDGSCHDATAEQIRSHMAAGTFFWLSLEQLDAAGRELLASEFGFHRLALDDAARFGQRPKIDDYPTFTQWVAHGLDKQGNLAEVHLFFAANYIVTVTPHGNTVFAEVHERIEHHPPKDISPMSVTVLYLVLDSLIDSYFGPLAELDDRIDVLEDEILRSPTEEQLGELFAMKRQLVGYRKSITPQRDLMAGVANGIESVYQMTDEDLHYFRNLYDHLIRISDLVDSYRDLISGAVDTHISMISNRLNVIMKQLTIIATVFLPLTFLTGFFGQNFAAMLNAVNSEWAFWVFGVGLELTATIGLVVYGRRQGWFGGPSA